MSTPSVFVSHSQDAEWCSGLVTTLRRSGVDVWFDQSGLSAGVQWINTIERELQSRDVFLLVITPHSWGSSWVRNELALALLHHKQILGVIHEQTPDLSGFVLIYQLLEVVGMPAEEVASLVAHALHAPNDLIVVTDNASGEQVVIPEPARDEDDQDTSSIAYPSGRWDGDLVPGAADFIAGIELASEVDRAMLHRLVDWALMLEQEGLATISTYYGKRGLTLLPRLVRDRVGLVTLYNMNGAYVQFWRSVFDRRAPLALSRIETLVAPTAVGQGTWTPTITESLLGALTDAYREAHGAPNV